MLPLRPPEQRNQRCVTLIMIRFAGTCEMHQKSKYRSELTSTPDYESLTYGGIQTYGSRYNTSRSYHLFKVSNLAPLTCEQRPGKIITLQIASLWKSADTAANWFSCVI